jgi:hypothetical protein
MFVDLFERTTLRQGDVIEDVLFPLSRMQAKLKFLGTRKTGTGQLNVVLDADREQIGKSLFFTAQMNVAPSFCAVLSQDCDVDSSQNPPPPSFAMCRLVPVPEGMKRNQQRYEALRANIDPYGGGRPFYQLFYVGTHPRLGNTEYLADYGMPMAVAWADYNTLLARKLLEMDDITRAKFRVKAGAYLGRPSQEDIDAGLANPWEPESRIPLTESFGRRIARAYKTLLGRQ